MLFSYSMIELCLDAKLTDKAFYKLNLDFKSKLKGGSCVFCLDSNIIIKQITDGKIYKGNCCDL